MQLRCLKDSKTTETGTFSGSHCLGEIELNFENEIGKLCSFPAFIYSIELQGWFIIYTIPFLQEESYFVRRACQRPEPQGEKSYLNHNFFFFWSFQQ